jgi:sulfate transport system ATP-binding protein
MTALARLRPGLDDGVLVPAVAGSASPDDGSWGRMDVTVENLVKEFGTTAALHGASLKIDSGELIALLGPSGSGKTTLLRIIAGLDFPTSGRVLFGDEDASTKTVQERNIGFVFQSYALFRHMTVFENVAFGLRVRPSHTRPGEKEIRDRVMTLLGFVQLAGLEKRYPAQLSGGQRQRVAFARALAIEPRLLLLDEPFGALDAKVRKELRRWLREVHDRTGHTTIFVTHDQEEALELADRVAVMSKGRIEQVGSADDIYDRPATPFVFDFIGDSSALPVAVRQGRVYLDDAALAVEASNVVDGPATLFFRPNHIRLVGDEAGALSGTVCGARRVGDLRRVEIETGASRHRIEVDLPLGFDVPKTGRLAVQPTAWRLFPGSP